MAAIIKLAKKYNLKIIEDNAQAIGCKYTFANGDIKFTGTLGHIGTTSFYPSKNLGAMEMEEQFLQMMIILQKK